MSQSVNRKSTHPTTRANRCALVGTHQACGEIETTASKTGRGGMWVGGQKSFDAAAHFGAAALQPLAQWGGDHSDPLRCGLGSGVRLTGLGLGQFWHKDMWILNLDVGGYATRYPVLNALRTAALVNAKNFSDFRRAAQALDQVGIGVN